jgi:DNA-binding response OmpR family regulator
MTAERIVLLVEDNDDLASLYRRYLDDEYRVRSARTGREAIRKATPAVDLVVLDYKLPDMLGTDIHDQFRTSGLTTPVVMVSGTDPELLPDRDDPAAWLIKPFYEEELQETVRAVLTAAEPEG